MEDWRNGGFGLYLHWPFCQSKCPYCDFNSHVAAHIDQDRWQRAYLSEIARTGTETPGRVLTSVFFGGGTPSLMEPRLVAAIMERIRATWPMANDCEVTLEANPGSVEVGRFRGYHDAGVNRVSLGLQALNDADLHRLGRLHSAAEGRTALETACSVFDRVSFDLIYARQDQSLADWRAELGGALSIATDHLSIYQLTIEDGTAFGDRFKRGSLRGLPNEDQSADFYELTQDLCEAAGLPAYEVSNHARPGAESRHNLIYWRAGDYIGIGPGAHGRVTLGAQRWATETPKAPGAWLQKVETRGNGEAGREAVTAADQGLEYLMMALRLTEGISASRYRGIFGHAIKESIINELVDIGVIITSDESIRATRKGRMVLNAVIAALAGE